MLRTPQQRQQRAQELRSRLQERIEFEEAHSHLLDLGEAAELLHVSRTTAWRMVRNEPGVYLLRTPGSSRPMLRVELSIIERILRRSANR